jgi:hypothetical protein
MEPNPVGEVRELRGANIRPTANTTSTEQGGYGYPVMSRGRTWVSPAYPPGESLTATAGASPRPRGLRPSPACDRAGRGVL